MKLYVYNYVGGMTYNWHSGAGVMMITDRDPVEVLREQVASENPVYDEPFEAPEKPDFVLDVEADEERVFVFPDAGCC
jgi:hypothetical protein